MAKKVLIVDNNPINQVLISNALSMLDCEILSAETGDECLQLLEEDEVAVVLLVYEMYGKNGIETLKEIRAHEEWEELPVILTCEEKTAQLVEEAQALHVLDCMKRPVNTQTVMDMVRGVLEGYIQ